MKRYVPKEIEPKWQQTWEEQGIYKATEDPSKPKRYVLEYFPYPSGAAMHVGHVRNYTIGDAISRFNRMQGYNVLHPMGWDAFGLPAENYAIKNKISPRKAIDENTTRFKQQLIQMGFGYDWTREIDSTDPKYYKWTQWFFLLLFKRGLAYQQESLQWWCPVDKTVLANEQVEAGKCWRCGNEVEKKALKQWFFKITDYADRLAKDLDDVNWSDGIKQMQRNWIGRSRGAEVDFQIDGHEDKLRIFTTRPDTLFGATFMVLAPEHPLVKQITTDEQKAAVEQYVQSAQAKSDIERQETEREKTGVPTGAYAVNPVNGKKIPVWVADYVLMGYGTGAIMAVPAHDDRDWEFARKFDLPIKFVYEPIFGEEQGDETHKKAAFIILHNPETDKAVVLDWGPRQARNKGKMLIGGGVEGDEDFRAAAEREIVEETGYKNFKFISETPFLGHSYFFSDPKEKNMHVHGKGLLYELLDEEKTDTNLDDGEKNKFKVTWQPTNQVAAMLDDEIHEIFYRYLMLGETYHGEGIMVDSGAYDGLPTSEAREKIVADLSGTPAEYFDDKTPLKPDQPIVERTAVQVIVRHPIEDKYLLLKLTGWDTEKYSLPMGGVDSEEDVVKAGLRELREETGYADYDEAYEFGEPYFTNFYHELKRENRRAKVHTVVTRLKSLRQEAISEEEKAIHEVSWVDPEELRSKVHGRGVEALVTAYQQGSAADAPKPAREVVNYKMRDWLISRQRYWGAPIPIIHCPKDGAVPVPEEQLPVVLPEVESYEPSGDGRSPLANVPEFVNTTCPKCGGSAERETDTMDGFACSSWYFLRFADAHNNEEPFDPEKIKFWLPVDDYIGGAEHAVMHLLYARFWVKVMHDEGLIDFEEPFTTLRNHGMILAPDGAKMSKSKGNTIEPDGLIEQGYGADSIRIMELFIGPWNQMANWSVEGMGGSHRFLQRIWTITQEHLGAAADSQQTQSTEQDDALKRAVHRTTKRVTEDLRELGFNTAIAALMELTNELYKLRSTTPPGSTAWQQALLRFVQLLAPFAPHISEELWQQLGQKDSVHTSEWPTWDEAYLTEDTINIVVQVNGKVRAEVKVPADADESAILATAKADQKVARHLTSEPKKSIYVPKKLVNFVV